MQGSHGSKDDEGGDGQQQGGSNRLSYRAELGSVSATMEAALMEVDSTGGSSSQAEHALQTQDKATEGMELDFNEIVTPRARAQHRIQITNGIVSMDMDTAVSGSNSVCHATSAIMANYRINSVATQLLGGLDAIRISSDNIQNLQSMEENLAACSTHTAELSNATIAPYTAGEHSIVAEARGFKLIPGSIDSIVAIKILPNASSSKSPSKSYEFGVSGPRKSFSNSISANSCNVLDAQSKQGIIASLPHHLEGVETGPQCTNFHDPWTRTQDVCGIAAKELEFDKDKQTCRILPTMQGEFSSSTSHFQETTTRQFSKGKPTWIAHNTSGQPTYCPKEQIDSHNKDLAFMQYNSRKQSIALTNV